MGQRVRAINPAGSSAPDRLEVLEDADGPAARQAGTRADPINPARPAPPPSILTVSRDVTSELGDWTQGVEWVSSSCDVPENWPRCPSGEEAPKTSRARSPQEADVFYVSVLLECDWAQRGDEIDAEAEAQLEVGRAFAVSRALWLGDGLPAGHPTLQDCAGSTDAAGTVVEVIGAALDAYSDCTGGPGGAVVHLPSLVFLAEAMHQGVVKQEGNFYRGPGGAAVSAGPGYPTDLSEIIVSGPVEYALGPVELVKPDERRTNLYQVEGLQAALVRFDCCCVFSGEVVS